MAFKVKYKENGRQWHSQIFSQRVNATRYAERIKNVHRVSDVEIEEIADDIDRPYKGG